MGFYHLDLDELAKYTGLPVPELKTRTYEDLEHMIKAMHEAKYKAQNAANAKDDEFARLVVKYFQPASFLKSWFGEGDIVFACADTGVTERSLCSEHFVEPGQDIHWSTAEFKENAVRLVPQYDRSGRELMERASKRVDVYRVPNPYQSTCHGPVVMHLLYGRYPELERFGFSAYGMSLGESEYEIYPKNSVYTPFTALMSGNIDAIMFRNRTYWDSYNCGEFTPENGEARLKSPDVQDMLREIVKIGRMERQAGHDAVTIDTDGKYVLGSALSETARSEDGCFALLSEKARDNTPRTRTRFLLHATDKAKELKKYTVLETLNAYRKMTGTASVILHVFDTDDLLGQYGINISVPKGNIIPPEALTTEDGTCCADNPVEWTFGWIVHGITNLVVRTDCPAIGVPESERSAS